MEVIDHDDDVRKMLPQERVEGLAHVYYDHPGLWMHRQVVPQLLIEHFVRYSFE